MTRPPYIYFNIGPTGAQYSEPSVIMKSDIQERTNLIAVYKSIKFQNLLSVVVNYHVEGIMNEIIQLLINKTAQKKHLHFLQIPPGKLMNDIVYNISTVNYSTVKVQAIPIILSILREKFPDSKVSSDKALSYIVVDWT
jgi:hypothetical protein